MLLFSFKIAELEALTSAPKEAPKKEEAKPAK
jgi:hypothetical protein